MKIIFVHGYGGPDYDSELGRTMSLASEAVVQLHGLETINVALRHEVDVAVEVDEVGAVQTPAPDLTPPRRLPPPLQICRSPARRSGPPSTDSAARAAFAGT